MKKIILLGIVFGMPLLCVSQIITIKDQNSGEPLEMVSILSASPTLTTTTNAKGQADISPFKSREKIEIHRIGYKTLEKSFSEIEEANFEVMMNLSANQLNEVIVSATRWSQRSQNVPSKISIISPRDMALLNPQTTADLLGGSGEVFIQKSQQGGGSPMIRGFSTNRLLYTVDGVRMNTAIFRAGNLQNVISIDAFAVENTEVFFGPGSVIYGSDAIGGVMSFQTLTPQLALNDKTLISGKAVSRYSSANNELTNHFDVNVGWKKWASATSITYSKFGDLKMGSKGPEEYLKRYYVSRIDSVDRVVENPDPRVQNPSGYSQVNLMQKVRFKPNQNWDINYAFHYSETSEYARYDRLIETQANGLPRSAVWKYGPQIWSMNNLSISKMGNHKLFDQATLRLALQTFEESRIDRNFSGGQRFRLRNNLEEVKAFSANLDFVKEIKKHKFFYGLESVLNNVVSTGSAVDIRTNKLIAVPDRYPASTWKSNAAYLNYQFSVTENLFLQGGLRYNTFKIESDFTRHLAFFPFDFTESTLKNAATTGSLGLVYLPSETWKISLNGSTGFRAPNVDDIGKIFDFTAGDVIVPNTNLKAEYARNVELNISKIFGDVLKFDVSGFYTYLDNAMVRRAFQVNGQSKILYNGVMSNVFAIQNAAFAKVYGINANLDLRLPAGFIFSTKYNYQLGKEEMDNGNIYRSRHAAPAFGVVKLGYQIDGLTLQLYSVFNAEVSNANLNEEERQKPFIYAKDRDGKPYSPGWQTLNFKAMHKISMNWAVSAGLENITDQRYRPYSSGLVAPGRNFVISLDAKF